MAYTTNPHMGKVRRDAVRLVKYRGWSMRRAARRYGVAPSTVSRWCHHPRGTGWREIPTESSRPRTNPHALSEAIVGAILTKRSGRRRCGQVIHRELLRDGIAVSLSSVQRTLDRCGLLKKRSPWKRPHDATARPMAAHEGALLQVDTVHLFSAWFTHALARMGSGHRRGRVRQANDNAHVERFNRTLQEECLDHAIPTAEALRPALAAYLPYYNAERLHMGLNYQTPLEVLRRS